MEHLIMPGGHRYSKLFINTIVSKHLQNTYYLHNRHANMTLQNTTVHTYTEQRDSTRISMLPITIESYHGQSTYNQNSRRYIPFEDDILLIVTGKYLN